MLRKPVARSRFQADDVSSAEPRLKYRRLVFIPRFSFCEEEEEVIPSGQLACKAQSRGRAPAGVSLLNRLILPVPWKILIGASGRGNGPAAPLKWLRRAVGYSWLKEAAEVSSENIIRTFLDRAPATLKKHLQGWHRWTSFCLLCLVLR